jgi:hypothetical protein
VTGFGQIVIQWWPNQPEIIGNQWDCVKKARKFVTVQEDLMTEENEIILPEMCDRGDVVIPMEIAYLCLINFLKK